MIEIASPLAGWGTPVEAVPDPVFAARMLGDGIAVDPVEGRLVAPGDGVVVTAPWLAALGGRANVLEAGAASSRVWLRLDDTAQADQDALAKLGVRTVARPADDTLHLIVDDAAPVAAALQAA